MLLSILQLYFPYFVFILFIFLFIHLFLMLILVQNGKDKFLYANRRLIVSPPTPDY